MVAGMLPDRVHDFALTYERRDGDEVVIGLVVPEALVYFEGHFEGNPMLPGVAQVLALVDTRARALFDDALAGRGARRVSRLKFQATIRPRDRIELALSVSRAEEPQVRFKIEKLAPDGTREAATSGVLTYA